MILSRGVLGRAALSLRSSVLGSVQKLTVYARPVAADDDPLVEMHAIVKRFGELVAVDGVDFELRRGEIHALLGENGAGKTTLMNILYGLERPDEGSITIDGLPATLHSPHDAIDRGIGMVHQHFKLVPRLTVTENVILGVSTDRGIRLPDLRATGLEILALGDRYGLPVSPDAQVRDLSVGEQQRVEIVRALYRGAQVLVLDEPTASLAPLEVEQLIDTLRGLTAHGTSVVIITHHLDEVMSAADRVTVLRRGRKVHTVAARDTNQRELARMMVGREVGILLAGEHGADRPPSEVAGPPVLELQRLSSRHRAADGSETDVGRDHERGFTDVDLVVRGGEIVTIAGVEGNGQTELEEALLGLRRTVAGRYLVESHDVTNAPPRRLLAADIGFVHSDRYRRGMIRELPISQNLVYDRIDRTPFGTRWRIDFRRIAARGRELVQRFSIATRSADVPAGTLSGGNAQKVVLARAFASSPRLIVAAQPTRGLDVGAIEFVWNQLRSQRDAGIAVLLITTDMDEVLALSDRCYVMYRGALTETPVGEERIGLAMGGARHGAPA